MDSFTFSMQPHTKAEILTLLTGDDRILREYALSWSTDGRTLPLAEAVPLFTSLYQKNENTDYKFAVHLVDALGTYGRGAKLSLPLLYKVADEYGGSLEHNVLAASAIRAAAEIDPANETILKQCLAILYQDPDDFQVQMAIYRMVSVSGTKAAFLTPSLTGRLEKLPVTNRGNNFTSSMIFEAVGRTEGNLSDRPTKVLIEDLTSQHPSVVSAAM